MGLDTLTDVEQVATVQDGTGEQVAPATEPAQQDIADSVGNADGVVSDKLTPATAGETLPSYDVADGKQVLLLADPANAGPIYVGANDAATVPLSKGSGVTLQVTDTGLLDAKASSTGDVLHLLAEVTA